MVVISVQKLLDRINKYKYKIGKKKAGEEEKGRDTIILLKQSFAFVVVV